MTEPRILYCPDCHCDLFNVYDDGKIYCSNEECGEEIIAEVDNDNIPQIH